MRPFALLLFALPRLALPPVGRWIRVRRERRQLARLDERTLRDIGLDRVAALREAGRPFWDLPDR